MWRDPLDELIADLDKVIEPEPPDYGVPSYDLWQLWFERLVPAVGHGWTPMTLEEAEAAAARVRQDPSFQAFEKRYPGWMGRRRKPAST